MADISFKISGSSKPFLAQLWNTDCTSLIQQKPVEYSGNTIIFGGLEGNTTYNLNISDNICSSVNYIFNTLPNLTPPSLTVKYVSLLGTISYPSEFSRQITTPKYVLIDPPLINGESVDLNFGIDTINTSNTSNNINLYCNGSLLSPSYINCGTTTKLINMKYGDTICYDMSTICTSNGNLCGHSILELMSVVGYGFSACTSSEYYKSTSLSITTTTTTTTTTTLAPITVFLTNISELSTNLGVKKCSCAKLGTSRPLASGESFRLYYTHYACSVTSPPTVSYPVSAYACSYPSTSIIKICGNSNYACSHMSPNTIGVNESPTCHYFIDVNSFTINNFVFWTVAEGQSYCNTSVVTLNSLTCKTGANFQLGGVVSLKVKFDSNG